MDNFKRSNAFSTKKQILFFANSKAIANQLKNEEDVSEDKIRLIYNSVDKVKPSDLKKER